VILTRIEVEGSQYLVRPCLADMVACSQIRGGRFNAARRAWMFNATAENALLLSSSLRKTAKADQVINPFKPKDWHAMKKLLVCACEFKDVTEEEKTVEGARLELLNYLRRTTFIASLEGLTVEEQGKPMVVNGRITVTTKHFVAYLAPTQIISVQKAASLLRALGAETTQRMATSAFSRQSRWALPLPDFDPQQIKPALPQPKPAVQEKVDLE